MVASLKRKSNTPVDLDLGTNPPTVADGHATDDQQATLADPFGPVKPPGDSTKKRSGWPWLGGKGNR